MTPLLLSPKLRGRLLRYSAPRQAGYGERKQRREASALPLFAGDPTMVKAPEEYLADHERSQRYYLAQWRQFRAEQWRRVRAWRARATTEQRAAFEAKWHVYPHDPCYALDLIRRIEGME